MKLMADFSNKNHTRSPDLRRLIEKAKESRYSKGFSSNTFREKCSKKEESEEELSYHNLHLELKLDSDSPKKGEGYILEVKKEEVDKINDVLDRVGKLIKEKPKTSRRDKLCNLNKDYLSESHYHRKRLRNYLSCSRFSKYSRGMSKKKKRNQSTRNMSNLTIGENKIKNIRVKIPDDIRKSNYIGRTLNHLERKSKSKLYKICRSNNLRNANKAQNSNKKLKKKPMRQNAGYNSSKKTGDNHEKSILRISSIVGTNISTTSPHSLVSSKDRRNEFSPQLDSSISVLKSIHKDSTLSYADDYLSNYIRERYDHMKERESVNSELLRSVQNQRLSALKDKKNKLLGKKEEMRVREGSRTNRFIKNRKENLIGSSKNLRGRDELRDSIWNHKGYNFMKKVTKGELKPKKKKQPTQGKKRSVSRKLNRKRKSIVSGRSSHRDNQLNNVHDIMTMLNEDDNLNSKRDDIRKRIKELKKVTQKNPFSSKMWSYNDNSVLQEYNVGKLLGVGSYSTVRLVTQKQTKDKFALKIYNKMKNLDFIRKTNLENEIEFLSNFSHNNIIKLEKTFQGSRNIYLMLEFVGSLSLYDFIDQKPNSKIKEMQAIHIFLEIAKGIKFMHDNDISHRDLKLDNIIVGRQRQIKLIDFGFCMKLKDGEKVRVFCGTPSYMAPEILMKKPYDPKAGDVWSFGICLYRCISGRFPFTGTSKKKLYSNIKKGKYPKLKKMSKSVRELIAGLLNPNPSERFKIQEILNHDWFNLLKQLKFYTQPRPE